MKLPGRQLIAKAVFAVAVVATTATVGVVGFAQAAQQPPSQNGYGGNIEQLIAAINQFRQAVQTATTQYRADVNACLGSSEPMVAQSAAPNARSDAQGNGDHKQAKDNFNRHLDDSVGALNSRVGDSRSAQAGSGAFEKNYDDTTGQVFSNITGAQDQLAADMGNPQMAKASRNHSGGLFDCLDQARDKYRSALNHAKADLLEAIRRILG